MPSKLYLALAITVLTAPVYADELPFKSTRDIPAPERVTTAPIVGLSATQLSNPPTVQSLPKSSLTQSTRVVEKIQLEPAGLRQQTVNITNDDIHIVNVSASLVNRISTPFKSPAVIVNGSANYTVVGQDVFIELNSDQPTGLFIREDEKLTNNSVVAGLTLVPKPIPNQNIVIVLDHPLRERLTTPVQNVPSDYTDGIRVALSQAVAGQAPEGYSRANVSQSIARLGGVLLTPTNFYSGSDQNIYVYEAQNLTSQYIELNEPSFYHEGVRAVAFFPIVKLAPKAKTTVYILADAAEQDPN
ncbi:hypothetical protein BKE30_14650 [Alkanindiges hydrocarboniclasticus]|uniref:TraK C-terminal domain-containing protein n=1 Tax=Alkanindiges hydrocarboniclasticus TaxID=1907941 RepID=A0A1S8CQG0_9GAMM|nr:type-F conjugative transfer system secretin TraK [Alkanindiges hydrocarboniclasticus]ONG37368.1 hypothetical protein BKE30_14650 [Alkanindiges hydrocarboniclasticus]